MLNPISQLIIDCFREADFDEAYIQSKIERLEKLDRWEAIFWATHQLDGANKLRFAQKIGVSPEQLLVTFETIRQIEFYGE